MVSCGDLSGLRRLLAERKVSLSDCDELGRSLLTIAYLSVKPAICKFL
ncbi:Protein of unknown function [Pyronema omphalodes CBS 100304]|uniref:Uncharacterized protein n=1 Tax=Pyronema omphalodes (strain CBS 100304) TaxID=1076935 RepID=U4L2H6_PYROM|nr:Protein of unknown function [Pyronema omphalodes CBS 100304]